jgi:hypothetical protein
MADMLKKRYKGRGTHSKMRFNLFIGHRNAPACFTGAVDFGILKFSRSNFTETFAYWGKVDVPVW